MSIESEALHLSRLDGLFLPVLLLGSVSASLTSVATMSWPPPAERRIAQPRRLHKERTTIQDHTNNIQY